MTNDVKKWRKMWKKLGSNGEDAGKMDGLHHEAWERLNGTIGTYWKRFEFK